MSEGGSWRGRKDLPVVGDREDCCKARGMEVEGSFYKRITARRWQRQCIRQGPKDINCCLAGLGSHVTTWELAGRRIDAATHETNSLANISPGKLQIYHNFAPHQPIAPPPSTMPTLPTLIVIPTILQIRNRWDPLVFQLEWVCYPVVLLVYVVASLCLLIDVDAAAKGTMAMSVLCALAILVACVVRIERAIAAIPL
ncbi:hypothetical protein P280DRAFT_477694 [Massarina eburnea CBS 473.64]|uniref:Uncharacterized protein n=1 Tax=Massarina eburnea CBS 473.64 TaxID=1395130 RepID=A0A6A6S8X4_9PLEO|nr:hypothetical protein P280DRAFT_477694 [Massarina eburnea CBS 473.64]